MGGPHGPVPRSEKTITNEWVSSLSTIQNAYVVRSLSCLFSLKNPIITSQGKNYQLSLLTCRRQVPSGPRRHPIQVQPWVYWLMDTHTGKAIMTYDRKDKNKKNLFGSTFVSKINRYALIFLCILYYVKLFWINRPQPSLNPTIYISIAPFPSRY